eukprot:422238-Pleurochrysis_carterae.AAC.2
MFEKADVLLGGPCMWYAFWGACIRRLDTVEGSSYNSDGIVSVYCLSTTLSAASCQCDYATPAHAMWGMAYKQQAVNP